MKLVKILGLRASYHISIVCTPLNGPSGSEVRCHDGGHSGLCRLTFSCHVSTTRRHTSPRRSQGFDQRYWRSELGSKTRPYAPRGDAFLALGERCFQRQIRVKAW